MSDYCLFLNIYVQAKSFINNNKLLPIQVHIHGGSFIVGSSRGLDPSTFVSLTDTIFITINYLLGPFGFMYFPGHANQAIYDQHLALKWVYVNADNGDRNKITISGFLAGIVSV